MKCTIADTLHCLHPEHLVIIIYLFRFVLTTLVPKKINKKNKGKQCSSAIVCIKFLNDYFQPFDSLKTFSRCPLQLADRANDKTSSRKTGN